MSNGDHSNPTTAWVRLWHPRAAVQVTIPLLPEARLSRESLLGMLADIDLALEVGWLTNEPSLAEGETIEEIGLVVRSQKEGKDGGISEIVDLYVDQEQMVHPVFRHYMNTADDVNAFEAVSGLKVDKLPIYEGTGRIERGKEKKFDRYVVQAPHHFKVVLKPNPRHDPNETEISKKKPRRLFVRWHGVTPPPAAPSQENQPQAAPEGTSSSGTARKGNAMARISECQDVPTLIDWRTKTEQANVGPNKSMVLGDISERISERIAWLFRARAANATSRNELDAVEREAQAPGINLTDEQLREVFRAISTTLQTLHGQEVPY